MFAVCSGQEIHLFGEREEHPLEAGRHEEGNALPDEGVIFQLLRLCVPQPSCMPDSNRLQCLAQACFERSLKLSWASVCLENVGLPVSKLKRP